MITQTAPVETYDVILARVRAKNTDHSAYLSWRNVKKTFYTGNGAIAEHFAEETKIHAKEILEDKLIEFENKEKEAEKHMVESRRRLDGYMGEVASGYTYFDFSETDRAEIEAWSHWLSDVPLGQWTIWHLEVARFLEKIPLRTEVLSKVGTKLNLTQSRSKWEYLTISAGVKGAGAGVLSVVMNQSLVEASFNKLQALGDDGWEVVSASPIVYGALSAVSTSTIVIILKRQKNS